LIPLFAKQCLPPLACPRVMRVSSESFPTWGVARNALLDSLRGEEQKRGNGARLVAANAAPGARALIRVPGPDPGGRGLGGGVFFFWWDLCAPPVIRHSNANLWRTWPLSRDPQHQAVLSVLGSTRSEPAVKKELQWGCKCVGGGALIREKLSRPRNRMVGDP